MIKFKALYIDILCFIIGPFLIAYNLFNFEVGGIGRIRDNDIPYYFFEGATRFLITLGIALVCWGFLRLYWKKNEGINK